MDEQKGGDNIKPILLYQCEYCQKLFKTRTRHHCKFDPALKNCFSCRRLLGIETIRGDEDEDVLPFYSPDDSAECFSRIIICECGQTVTLEELAEQKWHLNCGNWEIIPGYVGKKSFIQTRVPCTFTDL